MDVALSASLGWGDSDHNNGYFGVRSSAPVDLTMGLELPIAIGDHVTVTPGVHYSNLIDGKIARGAGRKTNLWTGLSVTFSF